MCRKRAAEDEAKDEPEGKRAKLDEPDASIDDEPLEADEEAIAAPAEAPAPAARPAKDKAAAAGDTSYKEAPFTFLAPSDPNVAACAAQLALLPAFPHAHLYARAEPGEPVRALYLATPLLHALLAGTPAESRRAPGPGRREPLPRARGGPPRRAHVGRARGRARCGPPGAAGPARGVLPPLRGLCAAVPRGHRALQCVPYSLHD
jgi:hypothetical protein